MKLISLLLTGGFIGGAFVTNAFAIPINQPSKTKPFESAQTITEIKAKEIALSKTKGGLVTETQLEEENGIKKYEMTIINLNKEFEIEINATTGKVLNMEHEWENSDESEDDNVPISISPKISLDTAKKTALTKIQGTITKLELDDEDNKLAYEMKIKTLDHGIAEVNIDAVDGKVLGIKYN